METKEQSFIDKEAREQKAIQWFIGGNKSITNNIQMPKFAAFDNWITSAATEYATEIKVRTDYSSSQIKRFGGAYIEFDKLVHILELLDKNKLNNPILYINFFADQAEVYLIDPNPASYTWELKFLQKNDFDKQKVWKHVACLPVNQLVEVKKYK